MKKKLVAILLMFVIALLPLTVMAEGEGNPTPAYYRMNIYEASDKSGATSMDFMILDDKVYIHAEKLAEYLGYSFDQSYDECCFTKYDYNIAYMFFFDTTDVSVYMAGNMIDYNAPYKNKCINDVSWVPYNFACALFGASAFCADDGFVLVQPGVSIFDVLSLVMSTTKPYKFDWLSEVGYSESNVKVLSTSASIALFIDGLFDGTSFTTFMYNQDAGIYNDRVIREIGDLFAQPSEAEVEAYAEINKEVTKVAKGIDKLIDCTEVVKSGADAAKGASIGSYLLSEYQAGVSVKLWDTIEEIVDGPMSRSAFCSQYNMSYQMYEKFSDASMVSGKVASKMGKLEDIINVVDVKNVSVLDLVSWGSKIAGYAQNMAARDENTVKILQKYAADSNYGLASPLSNYADDMTGESGAFDATMEFLRRDLSSIIVDKLPLEKIVGGPGALLVIGYNLASECVPYIKNTLVSMENFQFAQYAIGFQNDSVSCFEGEVQECFYDGKIDEYELKDVCDYAFAFLKFSLVARSCGQLAVKNMEEVDANTKNKLQNKMEAKNKEIAQYLAILSQAEDTNKNKVYGLLPSNCSSFWENTKEEEARIEKCIRIFAEKIEFSVQVTVPDSRPNMSDAISQDEAVEIVKNIINGFTDLDYLAYFFDGEFYTYDVVDTHKVIKDDGSDADTYVVAMYYEDSLSALFFVTGDGKEVWMGELQSDGDYYVMYQVNIKDFSIMDLFYYLLEIEMDLFENN